MGEIAPPKELEVADIAAGFEALPIALSARREDEKLHNTCVYIYRIILISIGDKRHARRIGIHAKELPEVEKDLGL